MYKGKLAYIEKLTPRFAIKKFGTSIEGTSPPGIFVGRFGYPKVFVGPLVTEQRGNTTQLDTPETWLQSNLTSIDITAFRMSLARGMKLVKITELDNRTVEQVRDIALSDCSIDANAEFVKEPRGYSFSDEHQPFGPSGQLKSMELGNVRYEHNMEKAHYDTDLKAGEAVVTLYEKGTLVSQIQKALSVGAFGLQNNRKLVPTRWSITAVDDALGKYMLKEIRTCSVIDNYQVYEHTTLQNRFVILLMPTEWQYEFLEAFIHVHGNEELLFSDHEQYSGRKEYAQIGGCYYSTRLAIAEKLQAMKKQAGALVFRESYKGYVPLGVWLVRESSRQALQKKAKEFDDKESAMRYIETRLQLPFFRYRKQSVMMRQRSLMNFIKNL